MQKIKPNYQGFVPAYIAHPRSKCAFYHCALPRSEGWRWCKLHAAQYEREAKALPEEGKVIDGHFTRPSSV